MFTFSSLVGNSRFYILATSFLSSLLILGLLREQIPSDQLFYIRIQQIFGLLSVLLLYTAVIFTPLSKLVGKKPWMQLALFARRGIGVSAAYFALLHTLIVFITQLGGLSGIALLPTRFKVSLVLGGVALIILLLMAATSFDKAIERLTFKRWKQLHRSVYVAGIVTIIHVWLVGTHAEKIGLRWVAFGMLAILFALEAIRIGRTFAVKRNLSADTGWLAAIVIFIVLMVSVSLLPVVTPNYHSDHHIEEIE